MREAESLADDSNATRHERSHMRGHDRSADEMQGQMGANAILQTFGFGYDSSHYGFFKGEFVSGGKVERDEYMKDYLDTLDKAKQAWEDVLNECIAASGNRVKPDKPLVRPLPIDEMNRELLDELKRRLLGYVEIEEACRVLGIPTNGLRERENLVNRLDPYTTPRTGTLCDVRPYDLYPGL